jgi:hypothetical protein
MTDSDIQAWLNSPQEYSAGLALYRQYGKNKFLLSILSKGPDDYNIDKLEQELRQIASEQKRVETASRGIFPSDQYQVLPTSVKDLIAEVKTIYKENGARHAKLLLITSDRERAILAHQILDADDKARDLLYSIDYYQQHQVLPTISEEQINDSMSLVQVNAEVLRMRTRISKAKRKKDALSVTQLTGQLEKLLEIQNVLT